jgi:hypothetical protein
MSKRLNIQDMKTNSLLNRIDGKDALQLLPQHMNDELVSSIAEKLSKWRRGELTDTKERVDLEEFAQHWGTIVLPSHFPVLVEAMYDERTCIMMVLILMGELDYLVQQEIVSRELNYRTYDSTNLFDEDRLKFMVPQFASTFFEYNGMAPFATEQVRAAMSASIERFLNDSLKRVVPKSLQ